MATESATEVAYVKGELDLQRFVENASWRDLLSELVEKEQLNPWDVDIAKVTEGYVAAVRKMKVLDLHIPANIVLAASILLKMKSDSLVIFRPEEPQLPEEAQLPRVRPEVDPLVSRGRMQPHKRITLLELMGALEDAIKMKEHREEVAHEYVPIPDFEIKMEDIDVKIDSAYGLVKKNRDKEGVASFSAISKLFGNDESVLLDFFVPLLFLTNDGKVKMTQEKFFDEIFIRLGDE